jgi:hypothetical protein
MAGMGLAGLDERQQSNVLNVKAAREPATSATLCPLQLDVIERALVMWSNPGDVVLSPFMGIGSEGVVASSSPQVHRHRVEGKLLAAGVPLSRRAGSAGPLIR